VGYGTQVGRSGQHRFAIAVMFALLAGLLPVTAHPTLPVSAATPSPLPPSSDTSVPFDPPVTIQRGNQIIQTMSIRRTTTSDGREAVADRIIVGFKSGVSDTEKDAVHRAVAGAQGIPLPVPLKGVDRSAQYMDVTGVPSLEAAIQSYQADSRVRYAEPDYLMHPTEVPNNPSFAQQYGMAKIQAPAAWDMTHGLPTVKIAILDCGIYEAHPDLVNKVKLRQDFTGSPDGTDDKCNHGTHVAGIASANTGSGIGVAGVGYNTALMNGKVLLEQYDNLGNLTGAMGTTTWITAGIQWATDNGAKVISMSLGMYGACSQTYQDVINYAWSKNTIVVAAAGNDNANEPFQPAGCTHVVSVASTDQSDARSSFSNFGQWVSVAAPGSAIYSTVNPTIAKNQGASYAFLNGTSMATPHVAGLAGLLWATAWGTSAAAVVSRLESTADPIVGTGMNWQYGRINAGAAVHPPPSTTTGLSPATAVAGGSAFSLSVTGSYFQPGATVLWNGARRVTTFTSSTQLTAAIPSSDIATPGTANITVANPDGSISSPALAITVTASPAPQIRPGPPPSAVAPVAAPAPRSPPLPSPAPASAGGAVPAPMPVHR